MAPEQGLCNDIGMDILVKRGVKHTTEEWMRYGLDEKHEMLVELTDQERAEIDQIIRQEKKRCENIKGPTQLVEYEIRLLDPRPMKQRYRPRNPAMQKVINDHVDEMLQAGVIEPSLSPWSSPIVLARKKGGQYRFYVDYRKLNGVTEKETYPLSQMLITFDKLKTPNTCRLSTSRMATGRYLSLKPANP
jgi:hypothetical protein